jgi:hypothetical protein
MKVLVLLAAMSVGLGTSASAERPVRLRHSGNAREWNSARGSPRGDLIMYSRLEQGDYEIFTIKPDGTGIKWLNAWKRARVESQERYFPG